MGRMKWIYNSKKENGRVQVLYMNRIEVAIGVANFLYQLVKEDLVPLGLLKKS